MGMRDRGEPSSKSKWNKTGDIGGIQSRKPRMCREVWTLWYWRTCRDMACAEALWHGHSVLQHGTWSREEQAPRERWGCSRKCSLNKCELNFSNMLDNQVIWTRMGPVHALMELHLWKRYTLHRHTGIWPKPKINAMKAKCGQELCNTPAGGNMGNLGGERPVGKWWWHEIKWCPRRWRFDWWTDWLWEELRKGNLRHPTSVERGSTVKDGSLEERG